MNIPTARFLPARGMRRLLACRRAPSVMRSGWGVRRRAAVALEFALITPVLLLTLLGMIEFGRMILVQHMLTTAAREGARSASLEGAQMGEVQEAVYTFLESGKITQEEAALQVEPTDLSDAETGDWVTVTVSVKFDDVSMLSAPMFLGGKSLTAACTMRHE